MEQTESAQFFGTEIQASGFDRAEISLPLGEFPLADPKALITEFSVHGLSSLLIAATAEPFYSGKKLVPPIPALRYVRERYPLSGGRREFTVVSVFPVRGVLWVMAQSERESVRSIKVDEVRRLCAATGISSDTSTCTLLLFVD